MTVVDVPLKFPNCARAGKLLQKRGNSADALRLTLVARN